jgi:hypothetical protein
MMTPGHRAYRDHHVFLMALLAGLKKAYGQRRSSNVLVMRKGSIAELSGLRRQSFPHLEDLAGIAQTARVNHPPENGWW